MKTVLITGAARRVGKALAYHFGSNGWSVLVHYHHSEGEAQHVCEDLTKKGVKAYAIQADFSREQEVHALIPQAIAIAGPLTCLINNASVFNYDSVDTVTSESWHQHSMINLRAPFILSQVFAQQLPEEGSIINIIDARVWNLTPHYLSYTLSKAGLLTLTQTLARALAPKARVNGIGPGKVRLPEEDSTSKESLRACARTPFNRTTPLMDICKTALLITELSSLTGQMIALDNGSHLGWKYPEDSSMEKD